MKKSYLILIGAIVIAIIVWVIERPDKFDTGDFAPFRLYKNIDEKEISKIEIEHLISGSLLERSGEEWKVSEVETEIGRKLKKGDKSVNERVKLPKFKADAEKIKRVIGKLDELEAVALVSTNPEKQATYQVGKMAKHIRLYDDKASVLADLYIGKEGPEMFTTYIRREGEDEVYLVREHIGAQIPSDVMSWRDKKIWSVPPEFVTGLRVKRAGDKGSFLVSKGKDEEWALDQPEKAGLDKTKVEKLVKKMADMNANRFAFIFDKDETGLDNPSLEIEVMTADGATNRLLIGNADKQGYRYAKLAEDNDEVYLLSSDFDQKIPSDWAELQ